MNAYIIRRLVQVIPTVLLSSIFLFGALNLIKGDAVDLYFGLSEDRSPEAEAALRRQLGIDKPPVQQYLTWLGNVLRGDFGESWRFRLPVRSMIARSIVLSFELQIIATVISLSGSLTLGIYLATRQNSAMDQGIRFLGLVFLSAPLYWVALILLLVLSRVFNWIPPVRYVSFTQDPLEHLKIIAIPSVLWGLTSIPAFSRYVRNAMLDVLSEDYVRTARAKGAAERRVMFHHALRNAAGSLATVVGLSFAGAAGGSLLMEVVFGLPGMGRLYLTAIGQRDYPLIMGISLLISMMFVVINLLTDLAYGWLDPRIRYN
jgi:peptide/nickel transport system permease protein